MSVEQAYGSSTVVRTAEDDICQAVIAAVAEARGVRPMALDTTLFEAVDPDALQRLFPCDGRPSTAALEVTFSWAGCSVAISAPGRVTATCGPTR